MPSSRSAALVAASAVFVASPWRVAAAAPAEAPPRDTAATDSPDAAASAAPDEPATDAPDEAATEPPDAVSPAPAEDPAVDNASDEPTASEAPDAAAAAAEPRPPKAGEAPLEPGPPPSPSQTDPAGSAIAGGVRVHIDVRTPTTVQLHRLGPGPAGEVAGSLRGVPFHTVCASPCDRIVDARQHTFFVAAPDIVPSSEFTLDAYRREATLYVKPGRRVVRSTGMGMTIGGALAVPVGILLLALVPDRTSGQIAGGTVTGVGGASLVAGIALLVAGRTRVDVQGEPVDPGPLGTF